MAVTGIICPACNTDFRPEGERPTCPDCGETLDLSSLGIETGLSGGQEKSVERRCIELYRTLGCVVYKTSQPQRPVGVSKGIPDLLVFRADCTCDVPELWFHEVKPTDELELAEAKQSDEQGAFEALCGEAGVTYLLGGVGTAARFLGLDAPGQPS